jgi:hypothetical protein
MTILKTRVLWIALIVFGAGLAWNLFRTYFH